MEYLYYSKQEVRQRILTLLAELEDKMKTVHPRSFFALTYSTRRERYLELLDKLERGEFISSFVMARLFHKGARYEPNEEEAKYFNNYPNF
jgi:hypothetical protein